MTTGLFVVVSLRETAPATAVVDNVRYTDFIYDPAVLLATTPVVTKDDVSNTLEVLDSWRVQWSVVAADVATYNGKNRTVLTSDAIAAVNAAYPGSI